MVAPIGYLNDRKKRIIYPDPDRAPLIRRAYELHAAGTFTIDRLAETVNRLGLRTRSGKPLIRCQYHRILQNPLYCGIIRYGGEEYEAKHEAIVPKDHFDEVQRIIETKSKPKDPNLKPFIYRGMFRCGECGCMITTETQKGHNYLHCTKRVKRDCSQPYVREEEISRQISEALNWITIPDDWADWMLQELEKDAAAYQAAYAEQVTRLQTSLGACDQKLKKLLGLYLDESLSQDEYRLAKSEIIAAKLKLNEELAASEAGEHLWFEPCIRFVKNHTQSHFMATHVGKNDQQRETLKNTGSNLRIEQKVLTVEFREPWKTLEKYGRLAHRTPAPTHAGAGLRGETDHIFTKAERAGFEPASGFKPATAFPVLLLRPLGHLSGNCRCRQLRHLNQAWAAFRLRGRFRGFSDRPHGSYRGGRAWRWHRSASEFRGGLMGRGGESSIRAGCRIIANWRTRA